MSAAAAAVPVTLEEGLTDRPASDDAAAETPLHQSAAQRRRPRGAAFPIVGIGASAGGLAAFEAFFLGMPPAADPGMAFVVVQHLAPDGKSLLAELLRRWTRMPVFEAENGMQVAVNCVYTIPPGRDLACLNARLQLFLPDAPRAARLPIDHFFRSLAHDQHARAVGIVLSGTGSDGARGLQAIKASGGTVLVQRLASAEFDGMPRSAVAAVAVDHLMSPDEMPALLVALAAHSTPAWGLPVAQPTGPAGPHDTASALDEVLVLLRTHSGHDFSQYKPNSIRRRIERRMQAHRIDSMPLYVRYLQQKPAEAAALFRDLLIGVTSFFRDADVFAEIEQQVIPMVLARHLAGTPLRVWCAGCSTGEEAYSIAMLLREQIDAAGKDIAVQIFGTDIDARAIAVARAGRYGAEITACLSPQRSARHFTAESGGTGRRVHKDIRDMLVFSEQNVIRDPPFSRLDIVCCRNLLIYMNAELQKKLVRVLHFALNPGGFLVLGNSEGIGEANDLFVSHDRRLKLYQRRPPVDGAAMPALRRWPSRGAVPTATRAIAAAREAPATVRPLRETTEQASMRHESPATARVDAHDASQAANEDLQSINEELETSKEELLRLNEALNAVNTELKAKVQALSRANNDMNNLLSGTGIATVFVDHGLRILRFTPTARELIHLIAGDIGRPVAHIVSDLIGYERLAADTQAVLDTLIPFQIDVQTTRGRWFTLRVQPYRTLDNVVEGAVMTFVDITEVVHTRDALHKANEVLRLAVVVRDAHDAITVQDLDGRTLAWNPGAVRLYGWSEADALAMNVRERIPVALQDAALATLRRLSRAEVLQPYETLRITKSGAVLDVSMISTALLDQSGRVYAIATTERSARQVLRE